MDQHEIEKQVKSLAKRQGISMGELNTKLGLSKDGLNSAFKNNALKVRTLCKIADLLGVSPSYFFETSDLNSTKPPKELPKIEAVLLELNFLNGKTRRLTN